MLSNDLRSLRGVFDRIAQKYDGQVFMDKTQAAAVIKYLDHALRTAEAQEQLIYATPRRLPEGVTDIEEARRHREDRAVAQGGAA